MTYYLNNIILFLFKCQKKTIKLLMVKVKAQKDLILQAKEYLKQ